MPHTVTFTYHTGLSHAPLTAARLSGSWDASGHPAAAWSSVAMASAQDDAGALAFTASVTFPDDVVGTALSWGVFVDRPDQDRIWGIPTEVNRPDSQDRVRSFTLRAGGQREDYFLTYLRRLGANKHYRPGVVEPGIRFALWAPNARSVELVRGDPAHGYIADEPDPGKNGAGAIGAPGEFPLVKDVATGMWTIDDGTHPALGSFASCDHRTAYMFKVIRDDGGTVYRTDLYSRCQAGSGKLDPRGAPYTGAAADLDGTKSCSIVIDPERVAEDFDEPFPQTRWQRDAEFWRDELDPHRPVPSRLEDLVIYELHVPGLGYGRPDPGRLKDAIALLDHLVELGVNAVELMPMAEYEGWANWGYGSSHFLAIEYVSGGRDQFKHFVRACHQRGIAVILDVVYNHFVPDGERDEWQYDSTDPTRNIYYWYEGVPSDYPEFQRNSPADHRDEGGYVDNVSTGWAPRYWEEPVRQLFISSAAALLAEFHLDGFRVDQTTSIHAYAQLHSDGRPAHQARAFGLKFLREWCRTLRLLKPNVFLIAEDYSDWSGVVTPADQGGVGFDAVWFSQFYHHLIGDTGRGADFANLLREAAAEDHRPLRLDLFAATLAATSRATVVYPESHDEAGNSHGSGWTSQRTLTVAAGGAPMVGDTRRFAEARVRVVATLALLSGGVPMFFMGEEVGCHEPYRYEDFMDHREDLVGLRRGTGAALFRYYRDLIATRARHRALRGGGTEVIYVHNDNRVLAFRRWQHDTECLVIASFANQPYADGYDLVSDKLRDQDWREVLNSDAEIYGGANVGNLGAVITARGHVLRARLPADGALVFVSNQ